MSEKLSDRLKANSLAYELLGEHDLPALLREAARQPVGQEPAAWMDPDGSRVLTAKAKADASSAYRTATAGYSVPLYAAPPAQVDLLRRALPFLHDEGGKYEDDGSNEPLELAREIEALIDQQSGKGAR